MKMYRKIKLTPFHRGEIEKLYYQDKLTVTFLDQPFMVIYPSMYNVLRLVRVKLFKLQCSTNERYRTIKYGIKRLAKVEKSIEDKLKCQFRRYNKSYLGEMVHVDTKRLPLYRLEKSQRKRYLFVGIGDFSRELYAGIYQDKSQFSAVLFLQNNILIQYSYVVECIYFDYGREYKGRLHAIEIVSTNYH